MARCVKTDREYAIKFFENFLDFEVAVSQLERIKKDLGNGVPLPKYRVVDNEVATFKDGYGRAMPPCIVTERGESLKLWSKRMQPDMITAYSVCLHHLQGYFCDVANPVMVLLHTLRWKRPDIKSYSTMQMLSTVGFGMLGILTMLYL